ncbi:MAG: aminotransferase class V-fold PLP-dependent enzyme [Actinobacteria bacterium]|nr:aminotransferase class V-fold PLP-dependent enzyme [Actinomycetota bacterium]MBU1944621.1 aminotransferase class V-fold PLP-dependent enzyme [Actinomycetota bacterium]MBU2689173.1 aminotransferase class V-fold PLP-dependent enzyme [Actinomycetota bacterium]
MRQAYFDNAATTYPKPEAVYREMDRFAREVGGSAGRSGHRRAVEAGRIVYAAREAAARLLNVGDPLRVVFTKNATEALNLAIWGLVRPGDHVVTTSIEHNSVMRPLVAAGSVGVEHSVVRCAPDGGLEPSDLEAALRPETTLVIITHASNVAGTILPLADVADIARRRGLRLLVDAAQTAGRLPLDMDPGGLDLIAFTGHKELFGPQGTGGLFVGEGVELVPLCYGGTGSHSTDFEQPREVPDRYESGTLNAMGLAGLGAGARFIAEAGLDGIRRHELELLGRLLEGLRSIRGVATYGPLEPEARVAIVPITVEGKSPPELAESLDTRYGIATRAGLHCSPAAHETLGTLETGALRISLSYMNTADEVDYLVESLREIVTSR